MSRSVHAAKHYLCTSSEGRKPQLVVPGRPWTLFEVLRSVMMLFHEVVHIRVLHVRFHAVVSQPSTIRWVRIVSPFLVLFPYILQTTIREPGSSTLGQRPGQGLARLLAHICPDVSTPASSSTDLLSGWLWLATYVACLVPD